MCQQLAGPGVDQFVSEQVLAALEPAALALSLEAAQHLEQEREDLAQLGQQRRERAASEAERVARQYRLVEPENRLVARQLERAWEAKLAAQQQLEADYHRFLPQQPRVLSAGERAAIRRLAADIPALWAAPTTMYAERKESLRQVVVRVVVAAQGATERVDVTIDWVGGARTAGELIRPVGRLEQLSYYPQLVERVRVLAAAGLSTTAITARLNAEGYRPPKRHPQFGPQGVRDLLRRLDGLPPRSCSPQRGGLEPDAWWLPELARTLRIPEVTLYHWLRRGWIRARCQEQPRRWVLWADAAEGERLRERHQRPPGYYTRRRWRETPGVFRPRRPPHLPSGTVPVTVRSPARAGGRTAQSARPCCPPAAPATARTPASSGLTASATSRPLPPTERWPLN